jgi:hypothetical protein
MDTTTNEMHCALIGNACAMHITKIADYCGPQKGDSQPDRKTELQVWCGDRPSHNAARVAAYCCHQTLQNAEALAMQMQEQPAQ